MSGTRAAGDTIPLRVLLVEDDDLDARLAEIQLQDGRVGPLVIVRARLVRDAEALLAGEPFDLVLLDLGLPDSRELESVERLRRIEDVPPIVVLTSLGDHELARRAIRHGAQDYLIKGEPDPNPLARAVGYALERERAARRVRDREQGYYAAVAGQEGVARPPAGAQPLRERAPADHARLVDAYEAALAAAWKRRRFEVEENVSGLLRDLADELGRLGATPRDAVELHRQALSAQPRTRPAAAARAFSDEARYVLLETMGYLAAWYRRAALGGTPAGGGAAG